MTPVVVDASVALAWCFPDESSDDADAVFVALSRHTILVPALWSVELINAIIVGERRKRLIQSDIEEFATVLRNLRIEYDSRSVPQSLNEVLPLARKHGLTAYDASYLELALRSDSPLATLDSKLQKACRHSGITLFR